jgi:cephalosporin hydroxylase
MRNLRSDANKLIACATASIHIILTGLEAPSCNSPQDIVAMQKLIWSIKPYYRRMGICDASLGKGA